MKNFILDAFTFRHPCVRKKLKLSTTKLVPGKNLLYYPLTYSDKSDN